MKKLSGQNTALQKTTQNAADAVSQANTNLNNARAGVKATQAEIDRCSKALALAQTNWDDANATIKASTATITTFGKEINLAESRFRLAAAGIKDIEKSVPGLTAKLTMLNEKMGLQERQVDQYAIALDAARAKLIAAQQANDPQAIQAATNEVIDAEAALNDARAALESTRAEIQRTNQQLNTARSAWTRLGESLDTFGDKMQKSGQLLTSAGRALTTTITTPIAALGAVAIKSSISFETAFASVRKTVDATEDEFASLSAEVKQMSTEVATSADDIAEVMAVAGQLGIATEHRVEHLNTYGCPYYMSCDCLTSLTAWLQVGTEYYRCFRGCFENLTYTPEKSGTLKPVPRGCWGYPGIVRHDGLFTFNKIFVFEKAFDTEQDVWNDIHGFPADDINPTGFFKDIFGDG